ncbi:hypothetical protein AE618_13555 [Bosea vaviloviae]|uniref:Uncharacterized protein n=1 Tax=Bosea vaviloviae TaxID=1526658 RepID=A0A0N0MBW0_9HYPH|nr:hypothetical protein AE618_13555 [Bosea vaviloviae]
MGGDGPVLPRKFARQRVDLRLTLSHQRSKGRAIALQSHARAGALALPLALPPAPLRDQCGRPTRNLPVDQLELALNLPARFLHASKLRQRLGRGHHDDVPRCQPMKLEGPA